jgi:predicted DNA-binding transcriptional regulator YafY
MRRSRQVIRLLGLLKALQDGERLHVERLAARFHVRRETVYRDLRALEELGFPLVGDIHGVKIA